MNPILVTSTGESTGKTAVAIALARAAADRGDSVGYMKPKGTRLRTNVGKTLDADPMLAKAVLGIDDDVSELEPVVYSPTFVERAIRGQEDPAALRERVREAYEGLAADRDLMVLEGGGTLATGGVVDLTDADVADLLDARVLLVEHYDSVEDVDEVLAAARSVGDRLAGVVFNAVPDAAYDQVESDVAPFLEGRGVSVLGILPRSRDLSGVTVGDLADELGGELLTDAPTDAYVERFAVGAMGAEAALSYFRRTKDAAVVTGGDRADIQTAAIEAPGVRCLILTGGMRPSEAVLGRAEDAGKPVLLVQRETLPTVESAEGVLRGGRTRDPETVAAMGRLLHDHADLDGILGS